MPKDSTARCYQCTHMGAHCSGLVCMPVTSSAVSSHAHSAASVRPRWSIGLSTICPAPQSHYLWARTRKYTRWRRQCMSHANPSPHSSHTCTRSMVNALQLCHGTRTTKHPPHSEGLRIADATRRTCALPGTRIWVCPCAQSSVSPASTHASALTYNRSTAAVEAGSIFHTELYAHDDFTLR